MNNTIVKCLKHLGYTMFSLLIVLLIHCSAKKQPLRVYGGEDADQEAYPYVVRLEMRYTKKLNNGSKVDQQMHLCTASALSSTWAITAAHCITDLDLIPTRFESGKLVIRYGSVRNSLNDKNTFSDVVLLVRHPMYVYFQSKYIWGIKNDIGLIKTNPMPLKRFIKLSPVDYNTLYGHEVVFGGYGITTKNNLENKTGSTLKFRKPLQIFKVIIKKCMKYPGIRPFLCLGRQCGRIATTCNGDSGGPVIHASGIVAVLSWGRHNVYCRDPTINTNLDESEFTSPVGPYLEWIASNVRN